VLLPGVLKTLTELQFFAEEEFQEDAEEPTLEFSEASLFMKETLPFGKLLVDQTL
jgi:hypothetical protein